MSAGEGSLDGVLYVFERCRAGGVVRGWRVFAGRRVVQGYGAGCVSSIGWPVTAVSARAHAAAAPAVRRVSSRARMSPRVLVAVLAGLVAVVATVSLLADRRATVSVVVASRSIAPGEELVGAVETRSIPASSSFVGVLLPASDVVAGMRASRLIAANEPVVRSAVSSGTPRGRVVSIPVARDHGVGGDVAVGDLVDVVDYSQSARFVASGLTVVASAAKSSGLDAGAGSWWVSVEVTADQALAVADALGHGKLLLVRSTGQPPVTVTAPVGG